MLEERGQTEPQPARYPISTSIQLGCLMTHQRRWLPLPSRALRAREWAVIHWPGAASYPRDRHRKRLMVKGLHSLSASYAVPLDLRGAHTSNMSVARSNSDGSSFSGAFTRLEIGHIVMSSDG
jgi:hypothetical protein